MEHPARLAVSSASASASSLTSTPATSTSASTSFASSPTPSVGHQPHAKPPGSGPIQLSSSHPNAVNYTISAAVVFFGIALIVGFALFRRWRKRRELKQIDEQIDAQISQHISHASLSRFQPIRTNSTAKDLLTPLTSSTNFLLVPSMTRLPSPLSEASTLDNSCRQSQQPLRAGDHPQSCDCPDCAVCPPPVATPPLLVAAPGPPFESHAPASSQLTLVSSSPTPTLPVRSTPVSISRQSLSGTTSNRLLSRSSRNVTTSALRPRSSIVRTRRRNDENAHRSPSVRHPSTPVTPNRDLPGSPASFASPIAVYPRAFSRDIMNGDTTTASAHSPECSSRSATTPRIRSSILGSPLLSDDAGVTTRSPASFSPSPLNAPSPTVTIYSSLDLADLRGQLAHSVTLLQDSPLAQVASILSAPPELSPTEAPAADSQVDHKPDTPQEKPTVDSSANPTSLQPPPVVEQESGERSWFPDTEWSTVDASGPQARSTTADD